MVRSFTQRLKAAFFPSRRKMGFDTPETERKGLVISLCILAASVLWFAFSMKETYTQVIDFPTVIIDLPSDKALVNLPPSSIRAQVEGEGVQVLRLFYNPPTVSIEATPGEIDLLLVVSEAAGNVSLQSVTPRNMSVVLENRVYKKVPVVAELDVQLAAGFWLLGDIRTSPDSVTVSGAASIMENITSWKTQRRQLGVLSDSLAATISLSDSLRGLVDLSIPEVSVYADVQEFTQASREIPVRALGLAEGKDVTFSPSTVTVTYLVPLSQFDASLKADDFYAFVPYSETVRDENGLVYPMLHFPDGLHIRESKLNPSGIRYYDIQND